MFPWLKHDNIKKIILPRDEEGKKHLDEVTRSTFMTQGLLEGTLPLYTATEQRIVDEIILLLEQQEAAKATVVRIISGDDGTIRRLIEQMVEGKILIEEEVCNFPVKKMIKINMGYNKS